MLHSTTDSGASTTTTTASEPPREEEDREKDKPKLKAAVLEQYLLACRDYSLRPNSALCSLFKTQMLSFDSVRVLDLSQNFVGPNGLAAVVSVIRQCPHLSVINLSDNRLNNESVQQLTFALLEAAAAAEAAPQNGSGTGCLSCLDLSRNPISLAGGKILLHFLRALPACEPPQISLDDTLVSLPLQAQIQDMVSAQSWAARGLVPLPPLQPRPPSSKKPSSSSATEESARPQQPTAAAGRRASVVSFDRASIDFTALDSTTQSLEGMMLKSNSGSNSRRGSGALSAVEDTATYTTVPNCFVFDAALKRRIQQDQRQPWRPLSMELDNVSSRAGMSEMISHSDAYVKIPFFPAMPLVCHAEAHRTKLLEQDAAKVMWMSKNTVLFADDFMANTVIGDRSSNNSGIGSSTLRTNSDLNRRHVYRSHVQSKKQPKRIELEEDDSDSSCSLGPGEQEAIRHRVMRRRLS